VIASVVFFAEGEKDMYDGLTGRYTFGCPATGEARVRLSRFRSLERLAGAAHPAVYRVAFECPCGEEHGGFVSHDELDWAPLGAVAAAFFNVMTRRLEPAGQDLLEHAARHIGSGYWPWSFFCYPEGRPRPVFPSAFRLLAPAHDRVGLAVRCPSCAATSVNLVSARHVDEPFFNDARVGVVEHVFDADRDTIVAQFREELESGAFDARRHELGP
jgi:hypothetical protein